MPFWDHVYELRNRLLFVIAFIGILSVGGYFLFPLFIKFLNPIIGEDLYVTAITEGFLMRIEVSFLCGIFLSLPILFSQISFFLTPALNNKQKAGLVIALIAALLLFIGGVFFAFSTVLPLSLAFLKSPEFNPPNVNRIISFSSFIKFFFQFLIGFGLFFEFPVALMFLMKAKVTNPAILMQNSKFLIPVIFLVSAVLTPPDVVSQVMLATPMLVLYFLCILVGKIFRMG